MTPAEIAKHKRDLWFSRYPNGYARRGSETVRLAFIKDTLSEFDPAKAPNQIELSYYEYEIDYHQMPTGERFWEVTCGELLIDRGRV